MSDSDTSGSLPAGRADDGEVVVRPYAPFPTFKDWLAEPFDSSTFDLYAKQLEAARLDAGSDALRGAIEVATKWAAIDTGAIEGLYEVERGFTISMAVSAALLENIHASKGAAVARSVKDALDAYEFVLDVATKSRPITEVWIRELHEIICRSQLTYTVATAVGPQEHELVKGKYKVYPNSPYNFEAEEIHSYASPEDTPAEMHRLVSEMRSDEFLSAHPAVQAAYAHYAFVCIHPFPDGNGRVSRALASAFLYRAPGLPLVIFADQKTAYISALEAADAGRFGAFMRFLSERVVDTIGMVRESLSRSTLPSVEDQLARLAAMSTGRGGLPHAELDAVAIRLMDQVQDSLAKVLKDQFKDTRVQGRIEIASGQGKPIDANYRLVPGSPKSIQVTLTIPRPTQGTVRRLYSVLVAKPAVDAPDFLVVFGKSIVLEVFLREVHPVVSGALVYRVEAAIETQIREMMAELLARVQNTLLEQGYTS